MRRVLVSGITAVLVTGCSDGPAAPTPPPPSSVSITVEEGFVLTGDTLQLALDPQGGSVAGVQWESLSPDVATVRDGVVRGMARGTARIVARAGTLADTARVGVLRNTFNVSATDFCANPQLAPVRIAAVGERSIILADTRNPPGTFSDADYRGFAAQFDEVVYPTVTGAFGEPLDVDRNGRFIVLFTRAVNELAPDPSQGFVAGFVWARDLLPRTPATVLGRTFSTSCPGSNEAEMTYLAIPDPAWPEGIRTIMRRTTVATIAHELQHAINASRRIFVHNTLPEELWLNEAMSHVAEELTFYRAGGLGPGQSIDLTTLRASQPRLDAVNAFQISNLANFGRYLAAPAAESPLSTDLPAGAAMRGAAWNLLRYAADRRGGNQNRFWSDLLDSSLSGTSNLQRATGAELLPWIRDWAVSLYASGGVPGLDARFRQASWNFRSVLPALLDEFPLPLEPLQDNVATSTTVRAASAAYLQFAVGPDQVAEIGVAVPGRSAASCRDDGAITSLDVGEVHTGPPGGAVSLCFAGGPSGSEYVLIPFHASLTPGANLNVDVLGRGIQQAVPRSSSRRTGAGHAFGFDEEALLRTGGSAYAEELHFRLREEERDELARRIPALGRNLGDRGMAAAAAGPLMVSVIRTR